MIIPKPPLIQPAAAFSHIMLEMFTHFATASMIATDKVHPNDSGNERMADGWYSGIGSRLPNQDSPIFRACQPDDLGYAARADDTTPEIFAAIMDNLMNNVPNMDKAIIAVHDPDGGDRRRRDGGRLQAGVPERHRRQGRDPHGHRAHPLRWQVTPGGTEMERAR